MFNASKTQHKKLKGRRNSIIRQTKSVMTSPEDIDSGNSQNCQLGTKPARKRKAKEKSVTLQESNTESVYQNERQEFWTKHERDTPNHGQDRKRRKPTNLFTI